MIEKRICVNIRNHRHDRKTHLCLNIRDQGHDRKTHLCEY